MEQQLKVRVRWGFTVQQQLKDRLSARLLTNTKILTECSVHFGLAASQADGFKPSLEKLFSRERAKKRVHGWRIGLSVHGWLEALLMGHLAAS
jgi:hypothetical protein